MSEEIELSGARNNSSGRPGWNCDRRASDRREFEVRPDCPLVLCVEAERVDSATGCVGRTAKFWQIVVSLSVEERLETVAEADSRCCRYPASSQ